MLCGYALPLIKYISNEMFVHDEGTCYVFTQHLAAINRPIFVCDVNSAPTHNSFT